MKKTKIPRTDGKVDKTFNISLATQYICRDYILKGAAEHTIQETGLMKVFELKSNEENKPFFIGRWDQNKNTLDVDVYGVSPEVKKDFVKGRKGYSGHHPVLIKPEHRTYAIDILFPEETFYKGTVFFNTNRSLVLEEKISFTDQLLKLVWRR